MAFQPRKQFGQHWLRSEKVLHRIVSAAELSKTDRILEIGPGTGNLTRLLLSLVQSVVAVEIDRDLCNLLTQKFEPVENFLLIEKDFLALDLVAALLPHLTLKRLTKLLPIFPIYITGPILAKLLGTIAQPASKPFDLIVLLVQKEVAERLCAQPNGKAYGALSVRLQYLAMCEQICIVPTKAFYPSPKVDSAVVAAPLRQRQLDARCCP